MVSLELPGRVAVVTGAGSGIGLATCKRFLELGATVVMCVHDQNRSKSAIDVLTELYPTNLSVFACNIRNYDEITKFIKDVYGKYKRADILVNNAGILKDGLIGMISRDEIDDILAVNLAGALHMLQGFARLMKRNGSGSIINISSIVGAKGNAGQLVYSSSKAALLGATYSAAKELAPFGIRVNAIAPGLIDTKMTQFLPPDQKRKLQNQIGMGRIGVPEEVADAIAFFASDLSRYVTGQIIGVDGGLMI